MDQRKKEVLAIIGSTRKNSSNEAIVNFIAGLYPNEVQIEIYNQLAELPHFNPDLDNENAPDIINDFRKKIKNSDGVIICTPEYVFSLPGALKNGIEWTVSTTVFSEKPMALITAAASGEKAHESLTLIMKTLYAKFDRGATLLIKGVKGKVNNDGSIKNEDLVQELKYLMKSFIENIKSVA